MKRYYLAPRFLYDLHRLRRNVHTRIDELQQLQEQKLRTIINHSYNKVPFYHNLLKNCGIKSDDIQTLNDLSKIPIITRKQVQENLPNMLSIDADRESCIVQKTSGSAGIPLCITKDRTVFNCQSAVSLRQFLECGGRWRDKVAQLRGRGATSLPPDHPKKAFYEHFGLLRQKWILTDERPDEETVSQVKAYQPDVIISYPSYLHLLAEASSGQLDPRLIFCTGEILTTQVREQINSAFKAKTIDSYGCTEAGDLAWQCPEEDGIGYHINADSVIIEFIKDGENVAPGEEGQIVLTNLHNYTMPFIRYNIGDIGVPSKEQCPCGRTLPLMQIIKGRSDDFILLPDGKKLSALTFLNVKQLVAASEYRIIQETRNRIRVLVKMRKDANKADSEQLPTTFKRLFGPQVETKIEVVDEIPRDESGKLRSFISKIADTRD